MVIRQYANTSTSNLRFLRTQVLEIEPIVLRCGKNGVAVMTALHYVVGKSLNKRPWIAWHKDLLVSQ